MAQEDNFQLAVERGELIGFEVTPSCPDNRKWVLIKKDRAFKPNINNIEDEELIDLLMQQYTEVNNKPYRLSIRELPVEIHMSDRYEDQEDYVVFENIRFTTIEDMICHLNLLNLDPDSALPAKIIEAP